MDINVFNQHAYDMPLFDKMRRARMHFLVLEVYLDQNTGAKSPCSKVRFIKARIPTN